MRRNVGETYTAAQIDKAINDIDIKIGRLMSEKIRIENEIENLLEDYNYAKWYRKDVLGITSKIW